MFRTIRKSVAEPSARSEDEPNRFELESNSIPLQELGLKNGQINRPVSRWRQIFDFFAALAASIELTYKFHVLLSSPILRSKWRVQHALVDAGLSLARPPLERHSWRPKKFLIANISTSDKPIGSSGTGFGSTTNVQSSSDNGDVHSSLMISSLSDLLKSKALISYTDWRVIYALNDPELGNILRAQFDIDFTQSSESFTTWMFRSLGQSEVRARAVQFEESSNVLRTVICKPEYDEDRELLRTAFGLEYVSPWQPKTWEAYVSERNPTVGTSLPDLCSRTLSVYLQLHKPSARISDISKDPSHREERYKFENTIVIFDMMKDVLSRELLPGKGPWVGAIEDISVAKQNPENPVPMSVIIFLFDTVAEKWEEYISAMHRHVMSLEGLIYENPADDIYAATLWSISKKTLEAERLMNSQLQLLEKIQDRLAFLVSSDSQQSPAWLLQNINEFNRLNSKIEDALKKPVANLLDLLYKSISIHDARQSLELNTSLWRLSWITFIFLPLTFLAGFFGMNVDPFKGNPSLKWYFVSAVPLMILVILSWSATKQWTPKDTNLLKALQKKKRLFEGKQRQSIGEDLIREYFTR